MQPVTELAGGAPGASPRRTRGSSTTADGRRPTRARWRSGGPTACAGPRRVPRDAGRLVRARPGVVAADPRRARLGRSGPRRRPTRPSEPGRTGSRAGRRVGGLRLRLAIEDRLDARRRPERASRRGTGRRRGGPRRGAVARGRAAGSARRRRRRRGASPNAVVSSARARGPFGRPVDHREDAARRARRGRAPPAWCAGGCAAPSAPVGRRRARGRRPTIVVRAMALRSSTSSDPVACSPSTSASTSATTIRNPRRSPSSAAAKARGRTAVQSRCRRRPSSRW